jgi:hypothetical protein
MSASNKLEINFKSAAMFAKSIMEKKPKIKLQWLPMAFLFQEYKDEKTEESYPGWHIIQNLKATSDVWQNVYSEMRLVGYELLNISDPRKSRKIIYALRRLSDEEIDFNNLNELEIGFTSLEV